MAKLQALPSQAIINGFKGTVDFYVHRGTPCARRWPRHRREAPSPAEVSQWPAFSYAARLWQQTAPNVQQAWRNTSSGTTLTGRDLQIKAYIAGYLKHF